MKQSSAIIGEVPSAAEILHQRAIELARPVAAVEAHPTVEALRFQAGGVSYGIDTAFLREVHPLDQVEPLPGVPQFSLGIFHVRGHIWSLVDLRRLLGHGTTALVPGSKAILLEGKEMAVGVLADFVEGIVHLRAAEISNALPETKTVRVSWIRGIHISGLLMLDGRQFLSDTQLLVSQ
jgi:purine-binding chemotaxis protein CheW